LFIQTVMALWLWGIIKDGDTRSKSPSNAIVTKSHSHKVIMT
jgi:hypothetical protein